VTREFARHGGGEYEGVPLDDIIFQIDGRELLGIVLVLAFLFVPIGISFMPSKGDPNTPPLFDQLQDRMGLGNINSGLLFIGVGFWAMIFASLVFGLFAVIWSLIMAPIPTPEQTWDWRFSLAKLAALTATLGAVVALPFTLIRLTFTRTQTETAVEALFNEKINAAVDDLHAQRQVSELITDGGTQKHETVWQDDVTRRNGAIDRLEGLAGEEPKALSRVARMLSVYVRELSREHPAKTAPTSGDPYILSNWVHALNPARSDMQNAAQVLGRLRKTTRLPLDSGEIDLTEANMQGFDLRYLDFGSTNMQGAKLQGATLGWAQLRGANLNGAKLQGAYLNGAQLQRVGLEWAQLHGADLSGAQLQGADLNGAQFDSSTSLYAAILRGAAIKDVDFTHATISSEQLKDMFGDASVTLPGGHGPDHENWPEHWSKEELDWHGFYTQWRAFQRSIGQDPMNPT